MLRHTVCNVEFTVTDMARGSAFYHGVLGWTIAPIDAHTTMFRSADGLGGTLRQVDAVQPARLPLLRVEVEDYGPLLDLAARHHGGYVGAVDSTSGEWTINLRDPDGNLIRLTRAAGSPSGDAEWADDLEPGVASVETRAAVKAARPRPATSVNGRAASNGSSAPRRAMPGISDPGTE